MTSENALQDFASAHIVNSKVDMIRKKIASETIIL